MLKLRSKIELVEHRVNLIDPDWFGCFIIITVDPTRVVLLMTGFDCLQSSLWLDLTCLRLVLIVRLVGRQTRDFVAYGRVWLDTRLKQ